MPEQAQGQAAPANAGADRANSTTAPADSAAAAQPIKFEEWIQAQPEAVRTAYEEHTTGLRNTIRATRDERDTLAKQIKDLLPKVEKGSEMEKSLIEFQSKLEQAERRAVFMEEAVRPGIDCRNPKVAYALATSENLFDRRGAPDWEGLKRIAPELFGRVAPPANSGTGTQNPAQGQTMNELIRRAAGRG